MEEPQVRADFDAMDNPDEISRDARFLAYAILSAAESLVVELRRFTEPPAEADSRERDGT